MHFSMFQILTVTTIILINSILSIISIISTRKTRPGIVFISAGPLSTCIIFRMHPLTLEKLTEKYQNMKKVHFLYFISRLYHPLHLHGFHIFGKIQKKSFPDSVISTYTLECEFLCQLDRDLVFLRQELFFAGIRAPLAAVITNRQS